MNSSTGSSDNAPPPNKDSFIASFAYEWFAIARYNRAPCVPKSRRGLFGGVRSLAGSRSGFSSLLGTLHRAGRRCGSGDGAGETSRQSAKNFWPIHEQYPKDLQQVNRRLVRFLESYAADFRNKSLTDERAQKLIDEAIAIEVAEANLKSTYAPKLSKALPVKKAARYLQVENEIRAVVKYDLAQGVPLVQ
jgi:hypothetical protein